MRKQVRAISLLLAVLLVFSLVPSASAAYSDVPAEMLDNPILRALAYTGFKVQKLKDEQHLYQSGYYGAALAAKGGYLSGITYGSSMDWRKTKTDSSSPTGVVPDIANMKTMDCISFITYFYLNYLPNVEGWDASGILNHPEKTAEGIGNAYNDMWFWYLMFDSSHAAWNKNHGISTVATLSYTEGVNNTAAYQNALKQAKIGDLLRMGNSGSSLVHYAIYAGYYKGEHWIIHVGNSRGPEIGIVSGMADSSSSKQSWVLGIYRFEGVYEESGSIEVYKTDPNGKNLAGAVFAATETTTGKVYPIGPTDSNGYAKTTTKIPYGTYKVVETKFPEGYTGSGQTEWTVTLNGATPNGTVTIHAVNALITGSLKLVKTTNTGMNLDGWEIGVYTDAGCANPVAGSPFITGTDGTIMVEGLVPGTYYCREQATGNSYWVCDSSVKKVIVEGNKTASVLFQNIQYGRIGIRKTTDTGENLAGWQFRICDAAETEVGIYTTGTDGVIRTDNLLPGTYTVEELIPEDSDYECATENPVTVTVEPGKTAVVSFTNNLRSGSISILKVNPTEEPLSMVEFLLEWSEDGAVWLPVTASETAVKGGCSTAGLTDGCLVTDSTGCIVFTGLHPALQYRVTETATQDGYQLLSDYAFVGELPAENPMITIRVVNAPVFTLPLTGSQSMVLMPIALTLCLTVCVGALVVSRRKERGSR